jgi:uncharacterized protein (TIGR02646 family)
MIRVFKPTIIPTILETRGMEATRRLCEAVERGELSLGFDERIYADRTVKDALIAAQHGKCCFCESKIGIEGDVEHFRPKAAFRQSENAPLEKPGYYWLAYSWNNLLLCCTQCNQREKKNFFPLAPNHQRARHPNDSLSAEQSLFLDPSVDDPAEHLYFDRHDILWRTERGQVTIQELGLDRIDRGLYERRREHLKNLMLLWAAREKLMERVPLTDQELSLVQEITAQLERCQQPTAEFSAMARCALQKLLSA